MNTTAEKIVTNLNLKPHPEGGFFRETYRSEGHIDDKNLLKKYNSVRSYSTCIYFMLTSDHFSAFHRIRQDEIWHFYNGSTLILHMINHEGEYLSQKIGINIENNEVPQFVVPGGFWFAAEVLGNDAYSLIGCTVSPGFDFNDFELKGQDELIEIFPNHEPVIKRLTRQ
jgi:predicted cupin superfamily sugar epimerase